MTRHDPLLSVRHMIDHSHEAVEICSDRGAPELERDRIVGLALVRLLEIVGEASTRVPEEFRLRYPDIPWRETADLRNRLIHGYDTVDFEILAAIIKHDLPELIVQLEAVLASERD